MSYGLCIILAYIIYVVPLIRILGCNITPYADSLIRILGCNKKKHVKCRWTNQFVLSIFKSGHKSDGIIRLIITQVSSG